MIKKDWGEFFGFIAHSVTLLKKGTKEEQKRE
jgi:hypothetical protein